MSYQETITPRIYVACLASYNEGMLYGRWLEIEDTDTLRGEIEDLLKESPSEGEAEEYAIHDYEGFGPLSIDEHESLDFLVGAAELVDEFGEVALHVLANHGGDQLEYARELLEESYEGAWDSLGAWAEERLKGIIQLAEKFREMLNKTFGHVFLSKHYRMQNIGSYLNFHEEDWVRDLDLGGYIETYEVDGQVHVFWSR